MPAPLALLALRLGSQRAILSRGVTASSGRNELKKEFPNWFKPVAEVAAFIAIFLLLKPKKRR